MTSYKRIILKKGKDQSLRRFHPWVFSGAVERFDEGIADGEIVEVYSAENQYLATGFFYHGNIAVRIISFQKENIDVEFWKRKLNQAYQFRKQFLLGKRLPLNVYRLFHAEGDYISGLVADVYNQVIVIQAHHSGILNEMENIRKAIESIPELNEKAIYLKTADIHNITVKEGFISGTADENVVVNEYNHLFYVNYKKGQKTGFFIDQRENRLLLTGYVKGKKVLNAFSYTGGFSVYALRAGAESVCSVDSSETANLLCKENIRLNKLNAGSHRLITADVKEFLRSADEQYEVIILDPPAFAKHVSGKHQATLGYRRLNAEAFKKIKKGGILFTFSCSQAVDRTLFGHIIRSAAIDSKRNIKVLHQLGQPPDHPVSIYHPEGEYLKGMVCYVE